MVTEEEELVAEPISVQASVSKDRRSATLQFQTSSNRVWVTATDSGSLEALIRELGATRGNMEETVPTDLPKGTHALAAYDPRWTILPDTTNHFVTLWLRHPGLGWHGFGFPRHEAGNIAKWLRKVPALTRTQDTLSTRASSFGGEDFLIATEGLGFYYYGRGENRIGPNPFEQIEYDSDRAAGVVAASIVEQRLEEALKSRMRSDQPKVTQELFRSSGALGPFSSKINLAYLLGILSDDAFTDLTNLKSIRNDFAHKLDLDSFDVPSISDRCKNFRIIERHIGPVPSTEGPSSQYGNPYLGLPNHEDRLSDPRFRYVMTAQLVGYRLGQCAATSESTTPFV